MKDYELAKLPDEQLIDYVAKAREAGNLDAARLGLGVFANRRFTDLARIASSKMPSWDDAEDMAAQTIRDVFRARFDGEAVGEAVNFIKRVLARRIADFYDSRKPVDRLPEEDDSEKGPRAPDAAVDQGEIGRVDAQDCVDRIYGSLEADHHRAVVDHYVFEGYTAKETAEKVNTFFPDLDPPMSDQNVHQIASRFRSDLRDELESD